MLSSLAPLPDDPILALIGELNGDPREDKVDLGVGVYRDAAGATPIFPSVKAAEELVLQAQDSKSYLGLRGDVEFCALMEKLILGDAAADRRTSVQSTAGSGALSLHMALARRANPEAVFWLSDPTWPNHPWMIAGQGAKIREYAYFDADSRSLRREAMFRDLAKAGAGDVVLLHGCCHNPTGANLTLSDWERLTEMAVAQGFLPFVDLAYQGFGDGLEEDVAGLRHMADRVPEMLIAASCSKNFGLYRDRVGAAILVTPSPAASEVALSNLMAVQRQTVSMPPDHGAAAVRAILSDEALGAQWRGELGAMRERMLRLRAGLAEALRVRSGSDRFGFIAEHRGMFSLLGCGPEAVEALKRDHAIYIVGDGRMNIAGLPDEGLDRVAEAFLAVGL